MLRSQIDQVLRERNLWNDKIQAEFEKISNSILNGERQLARGRINKSAAKAIALKIARQRTELQNILLARHDLDSKTAEAQAENMQFNYFVSACTVYNEEGVVLPRPYFKDLDDYLNRMNERAAIDAATALANLLHGLDPEFRKKLPENKFLLRYGYMNDDLHLVDKEGNLIDEEGRRVKPYFDEKTGRTIERYVNEKGEFTDKDGNLLDEEGFYTSADFEPFIEDE